MSQAVENLQAALQRAGVVHSTWSLPARQSLCLTSAGPVVIQGTPLISGLGDVSPFSRAALIPALRTDQAGQSNIHRISRGILACGSRSLSVLRLYGEEYIENYPAVDVT